MSFVGRFVLFQSVLYQRFHSKYNDKLTFFRREGGAPSFGALENPSILVWVAWRILQSHALASTLGMETPKCEQLHVPGSS